MNASNHLLAAAGDVGGARALLPALSTLAQRGGRFSLLSHGFLGSEAPAGWQRVSVERARELMATGAITTLVFGTSVADPLPLTLAREARALGLATVCVLDNWMNYRRRLEVDGREMFIPDTYALMDELARAEAIADGVPGACLEVVGQPALSALRREFLACPLDARLREVLEASGWGAPDKRLLAFISEPAEADQGADASHPRFRGYTEKTVLRLLARGLQPFAAQVQVGLVPHPREDPAGLLKIWEECRGVLRGGLLPATSGRESTFIADGICGMSSLLLYEAFLLGKPVISLQPGLRLPHLQFLKKKGLEAFVTDGAQAPSTLARWCCALGERRDPEASPIHPELAVHENAAARLADILCATPAGNPAKRSPAAGARGALALA